jgi:formamidopyrimidine-DNA glycosylase
MPELPEVETVRRGLEPVLLGRRLERVVARRPDLRFPLPQGFAAALCGHVVTAVDRRGKHLLLHLDDDRVLMAHLGMSGRFHVFREAPPPPDDHDHVVFETDAGVVVRFHDPRRFGFMDLTTRDRLAEHPMLKRLGPEPLGEAFTGRVLAVALARRETAVKTALLDQSVVAGIGNIYASESLFRARLSPTRWASSVDGPRAGRLVAAIRDVLSAAIEAGGATLRDHRRPSGELGTFQHGFAVYGRTGEACPGCTCDPAVTGGIRRLVLAGRSTFYCAKRQR